MYTLKVFFKDDTTIEIDNVKYYEIDCKFDMFFVYLENRKIMIPRDVVKMIGRVEDFPNELQFSNFDE